MDDTLRQILTELYASHGALDEWKERCRRLETEVARLRGLLAAAQANEEKDQRGELA